MCVVLQNLDTLGINVENAAQGVKSFDCCKSRSVAVARELGPLQELVVFDGSHELLASDKVVVDAVNFSRAGFTRGVRDAEAKLARVGSEKLGEKS